MNDSLVYSETIIEDSISVRSPSTFDVSKPLQQELNQSNGHSEVSADNKFIDASVQTLLSLTSERSVDESEFSHDESFDGSAISGFHFSEPRKSAHRAEMHGTAKDLTLDDYVFCDSNKEMKRVDSATRTSSRSQQTYCCIEKRDPAKSPTPPRTFKRLHRPKKIDRKRHSTLDDINRIPSSQIPNCIRNSSSSYSSNEKCCVNSESNALNCTLQKRLDREQANEFPSPDKHWTEVSLATVPESIIKIMKDVQIQARQTEADKMKRVCICSCSCASCRIKENPLSFVSCSCANLSKDIQDTRLRDFRSCIRQELLAIRRRLVARTASPQVAKTLPFLKGSYRCYAGNTSDHG